ncbi:MAG TPA: hypothetical protein PJ993_03245 [Candidatus Saccharibacteria bacterium]|nr:hypothetical protein [Candidatus Saccharibacteria bacterium]HMT39917.1 hypothetical protein [Candidatus Saccharibacteria bacterium]
METSMQPEWLRKTLLSLVVISIVAIFALTAVDAKQIYAIPFVSIMAVCFLIRLFFWWNYSGEDDD